jgi:hypothetical protein
MRIKIGTYSIRIKKYTARDLNLEGDYNNVNFYLYQQVFFILFIPVLPMEKFWKSKNALTNENIITNAKLRTELNIIALKQKSPLWSYSGSIILLAPFIYFLGLLILNIGNEEFDRHQKKSKNETVLLETIKKINQPELNDIYNINMVEIDPELNVKGKAIGFKKESKTKLKYQLIDFLKDSLKLKLTKYPKYYYSNLILKSEITLSKQSLIDLAKKNVINSFNEKGTTRNPDLQAVYRITKIIRSGE